MITLKDYIGNIQKEITNARVQADLETLLIAKEYANNPLLKHFSVPNIRMKDVELNIPVAIDRVNATPVNKLTLEGANNVYIKSFQKAYTYFNATNPEIPREINLQVEEKTRALAERFIAEINNPRARIDIPGLIESYAIRYAETTFPFVEKTTRLEPYQNYIVPVIKNDFEKDETSIEDIPVIVETLRLKEINDRENMITIKMNIRDDAMEWSTETNEDGSTSQVLIYE